MELRDAVKLLGLPGAEDLDDAEILRRLQARLARREVPPGHLRQLLHDVQMLSVDLARIDHFRFQARVGTDGTIATAAESVSVPTDYDFVVTSLRGFIQETVNEAANDRLTQNWARLLFNCKEEGTNRDVFSSDVSFAELLDPNGPPHPIEWWGGIHRFARGRKILPTISVDTASTGPGAWTTWATAKVVGVGMVGYLVTPEPLP